MVSKSVHGMLTLIMQETLANAGLRWDISSHCLKAPISWRSTLQSTIASSTTKAEYATMTEAIKEYIWIQRLLNDLEIDQDQLKINCDSMNAIYLVKNQVYHARTKHIDVRFHFIREILKKGDLMPEKNHTKVNPANKLTKVVLRAKFNHYKNLLHILPVA